MEEEVSYTVIENYIRVNSRNSVKNEEFYIDILSAVFLDKRIKLMTIEPQKDSFGLEIDPGNKVNFIEKNALVNDIECCSINLLKNVFQSEDFKRGFLALVIDVDPIMDLVTEFEKFQKDLPNRITALKSTISFFDYDYNNFYLFNSKLNMEFFSS